MNEPHCHETGRQIELLNEHSQTLYIEYRLARDGDDEDRYPIIELSIQDLDSTQQAFRLCSRADCETVIASITEAMNSAFPL